MRKCASRAIRVLRNSGFQSGTVSGSYFKRLSDIYCRTVRRLLLAPLPLFNFGNNQQKSAVPPPPPTPPRGPGLTPPNQSSGPADHFTHDTGPSCERLRFFFTPAGADYYLLSERRIRRSVANLGQNNHLQRGEKKGGINLPKPFPGTKENQSLEASP